MYELDSNELSLKKHYKELEQEKIILLELEQELSHKIKILEETKFKLEELVSQNSIESEELMLEKDLISKINQTLSEYSAELEKIKAHHEQEIHANHSTIKELKQEKIIFTQMNKSLEEKIQKLENTNLELQTKLRRIANHSKLSWHAKQIMIKTYDDEATKIESASKKYYLTIALSAILITAVIVPYSLFTIALVGQEHRVDDLGNIKSGYVIQNLKGDKIDTWLSWRLSDGAALYVNILNAKQYPEKAEIIKNAITSKEFYEIDDSLLGKPSEGTLSKYYLGWVGALETASQKGPSQFYIPKNIEIIDSENGAGDITIILEKKKNGDGFTGWTKSIADESQNQILKSEITIYDIENLSENQLMAITRHELGHAFGLAHSTAEEDLMHPTLETPYPYISHCDIEAISSLYDGGKKSEVVCEK